LKFERIDNRSREAIASCMLGGKQGEIDMTSPKLTGWNLWIKDGKRTRNFSVAEPDRAKAEKLVLERAPGATVSYGNVLLNQVMVFLGAKTGQIFEWFSAEPGQPIKSPLEKIEAAKNASRT
jgi:hypothetical protein